MDDIPSILIQIIFYVICGIPILVFAAILYRWEPFGDDSRSAAGRYLLHKKWKRENTTVHYGPAMADYAGYLMEHFPMIAIKGWVGIADDRLVFSVDKSYYERHGVSVQPIVSNASISLAGIRWLSLAGGTWLKSGKVFIGYQTDDSYSIHAYPRFPKACVNQIIARCPTVRVESSVIDPTATIRYQQQIHGNWEQLQECLIYLAPDSVWSNGYVLFMLDQLTQITVLPADEIPLIKDAMLKLNYTAPDGRQTTAGFSMLAPVAKLWAEQLQANTGVEFTLIDSRKKKQKG